MLIKLSARDISKVAQTFPDSDQYVYYDVEVLTIEFHELAPFQLVIVCHPSDRFGFCRPAQVSFDFNFLHDDLVLADYFPQFSLDQIEHLSHFWFVNFLN